MPQKDPTAHFSLALLFKGLEKEGQKPEEQCVFENVFCITKGLGPGAWRLEGKGSNRQG